MTKHQAAQQGGLLFASQDDVQTPQNNVQPKIDETPEERRKRQYRENQAAYRARKRAKGDKEIRISLTSMELAEFERLWKAANCPHDSFPLKALLLGARFVANSGKGKKPSKSVR